MTPADLTPWLKLAREHGVRSIEFEVHVGPGEKVYHTIHSFELFMPPPPLPPKPIGPHVELTDEDFLFGATHGLPNETELAERCKLPIVKPDDENG